MSVYSGFSSRSLESNYDSLCLSLITILSQRVLKAVKSEYCDDAKFSRSVLNIYKKLIELELHKYMPPRASEAISDLVSYCSNNFSIRSNSNESTTPRRFTPEKAIVSKTPNFSFLDKIIEERPKLNRSSRKEVKKKGGRADTSHPYYESMMGRYLKMSLKSPLRSNQANNTFIRPQGNQVQLTDGMFFRLF